MGILGFLTRKKKAQMICENLETNKTITINLNSNTITIGRIHRSSSEPEFADPELGIEREGKEMIRLKHNSNYSISKKQVKLTLSKKKFKIEVIGRSPILFQGKLLNVGQEEILENENTFEIGSDEHIRNWLYRFKILY